MEKLAVGRKIHVVAAAHASGNRLMLLSRGSPVALCGDFYVRRRTFPSSSSLRFCRGLRVAASEEEGQRASGVVRLWRESSRSGRFAGLGDFTTERRTFVRSCVAAWLVACTAAMADTAQGQSSSGSDAAAAKGTVVLYNYALAFNPAKAKLALEESGLKYTETKIDLFNGQSLEPWYLKLNPSASAPTLVAGKEVIPESKQIIEWVDKQGSPLGGDAVDRSFISEWLSKVDTFDGNLYAAANTPAGIVLKVGNAFKIKVAKAQAKRNPDLADLYNKKIVSLNKLSTEPNDPSVAASNLKQLISLLDEAESRLASSKFLAGEQYSAADAIFTPILYRLYFLKKDSEFFTSRPNIRRYYQDIKKRPSYKAVFGVSDNSFATVPYVLPALSKILVSSITGNY